MTPISAIKKWVSHESVKPVSLTEFVVFYRSLSDYQRVSYGWYALNELKRMDLVRLDEPLKVTAENYELRLRGE